MPDKRGERIGRAAYDASGWPGVLWDDMTERSRQDHIDCAIAAVAKAREIDTCETCEAALDTRGNVDCLILCHMILKEGSGRSIMKTFCCNRHEPKGE